MSTPMMMTNCPTDETVAAFVDGRLPPEARAEVMAHIADCPDCYALVSAGWDYQAMEQKEEEKEKEELAPVVEGRFGSWWMWTAAAIAATVVIVLQLPVTREWLTRDWIGSERERSDLIAAQNSAKVRPVEGRLSGFSYQPLKKITRGSDDTLDDDLSKITLEAAAAKLKARTAETAREWQALSAAHLLLGERREAIEAIEKAAALSPRDPAILNDRIVAYLAQYRWQGDADAAQRALEAAESVWQVEQTPEIAFNRALAFEAVKRRNESIGAWQEYLALDAKSPWANEARQHLQRLQDPEALL